MSRLSVVCPLVKYQADHLPSSALTEPPDPYTIDKIRVTKIDKDFMRFVSSTRMTHVMWNEETEQDIEEAMDAHSRQMARQEQRKLVGAVMLSKEYL